MTHNDAADDISWLAGSVPIEEGGDENVNVSSRVMRAHEYTNESLCGSGRATSTTDTQAELAMTAHAAVAKAVDEPPWVAAFEARLAAVLQTELAANSAAMQTTLAANSAAMQTTLAAMQTTLAAMQTNVKRTVKAVEKNLTIRAFNKGRIGQNVLSFVMIVLEDGEHVGEVPAAIAAPLMTHQLRSKKSISDMTHDQINSFEEAYPEQADDVILEEYYVDAANGTPKRRAVVERAQSVFTFLTSSADSM
jgi:hypothetical protein